MEMIIIEKRNWHLAIIKTAILFQCNIQSLNRNYVCNMTINAIPMKAFKVQHH